MYDLAVIGAGVIGAMIARFASAYDLKICLIEKEDDVCMGASKANSGIVHAGFDAKEGSLKAKLNVRGSEMMKDVAKDLGVKYQNNGSLVIGFGDEDRKTIELLYERGLKNGVKELKILDSDQLHQIEPNVSKDAVCALLAPTGAIVCPYELNIAAVGNAMDNGAELRLGFEVKDIKKIPDGYRIISEGESIDAKYVVNAAGIYADKIAKMVGDSSFDITARKGEYILLDKECGNIVSHTIFRTPTKMGKGILITPTVDGNLLTGPTSENTDNKEDKTTSMQGISQIIKQAGDDVKKISFAKSITSFCGLRAAGNTGDFIINSPFKGFINAAGIESPGLSASPAIGEYIIEMLKKSGLVLNKKKNYNPKRKSMSYFRDASIQQKNEIIKKDKRFGHIICRCEGISEGEIIEAIHTNPIPSDLDGIKRRTRAQMGRCQGGFCMPYIIELLEKELGISYDSVTKSGDSSYINVGMTKGGGKA